MKNLQCFLLLVGTILLGGCDSEGDQQPTSVFTGISDISHTERMESAYGQYYDLIPDLDAGFFRLDIIHSALVEQEGFDNLRICKWYPENGASKVQEDSIDVDVYYKKGDGSRGDIIEDVAHVYSLAGCLSTIYICIEEPGEFEIVGTVTTDGITEEFVSMTATNVLSTVGIASTQDIDVVLNDNYVDVSKNITLQIGEQCSVITQITQKGNTSHLSVRPGVFNDNPDAVMTTCYDYFGLNDVDPTLAGEGTVTLCVFTPAHGEDVMGRTHCAEHEIRGRAQIILSPL